MTRPSHATLAAVVLATSLVIINPRVASPQSAPLQGFDDYAEKARAAWAVPGLAIVVVKDDAVAVAKGYGVRTLGESAPVDARTIFAIGSATKAFTAASLAMLVDEGKMSWDDPVATHLRDFQLFDPYVTREITVRDLLTHRSGLDRGDALQYGSLLERSEILRRLRYQKPSWSFRSHFGYNNIMFLAAGEIVPALTGQSWDDFVKARIFTPLEMTSSSTSIASLKHQDNVATPHARTDGGIRPIPWRSVDNCAPAGSINSSVSDLTGWLRLQLGRGSYGTTKLLSLAAVDEMHKPQMIVPIDAGVALTAPGAHVVSYGFGWFLHDYHGRTIVQHGGTIDGMVAQVAMIPEERLGVAILTNLEPNQLPAALMYRVFDAYLGLPAQDWSAQRLEVQRIVDARKAAAAKRAAQARAKDTKPSLPPAAYVGTYRSRMYGDATVTEEHGALRLTYSATFSGALDHWHFDTFHITWAGAGMGDALVTFTLDAQGKVQGMKVPDVDDFERVRR